MNIFQCPRIMTFLSSANLALHNGLSAATGNATAASAATDTCSIVVVGGDYRLEDVDDSVDVAASNEGYGCRDSDDVSSPDLYLGLYPNGTSEKNYYFGDSTSGGYYD